MRSSVFPDPAGAWTMKEAVGSSARSRCARSGTGFRTSLIGFAPADRAEGCALRDAAGHLLVAIAARGRAFLGIHARVAGRESRADGIELEAQRRHQLRPIRETLRRALAHGAHLR